LACLGYPSMTVWPKPAPQLTPEQQHIREDFYNYWLTELPKRYSVIEEFNHGYPLRSARTGFSRTLDIGAGRGEHVGYENLNEQEYVAMDLRPELLSATASRYPQIKTLVGDIHERQPFEDGYFDRILAIHVLEHLPNLPVALDEVRRLLAKGGQFSVLIPCDPGFAYSIARNISAKRMFIQRYHMSYDWFVAAEHINPPHEILAELTQRFQIVHQVYFPLGVPIIPLNLVIGMTLESL
ncbi:MAG: class I SAM-dependent methyltransferase, partial [Phototrophicaceae bacterium]